MSQPDYANNPGKMFDNALMGFNKRAIGAIAPKFFKALAIASEPFFRVNMGPRYLDSGALSGGIFLWILATAASGFTGGVCGGRLVGLAIGVILAFLFIGFRTMDTKSAMKRHLDGVPRHSMSRGEPRIKDEAQALAVKVGAAIILILVAMPLCVLFVVSIIFSSLSATKQQEAIYSRYYDAIDAKIEAEQLQSALLGETPPEYTYLYKPLSNALPDEMRKNIAAAAVGAPVKVVVRAPKALTTA